MNLTDKLLIDTDVLIDYLRNHPLAVEYLENLTADLLISSITVAELYTGVREGKEREQLKNFLHIFEIIPITTEIAVLGGLCRRDYGKSHGVGLADAIIAATAEIQQASIVTLNQKHFQHITKNLIIPYQKT